MNRYASALGKRIQQAVPERQAALRVIDVVLGAQLGLVEDDLALTTEVVDREDGQRLFGLNVDQV